jgi:hypothetical protein
MVFRFATKELRLGRQPTTHHRPVEMMRHTSEQILAVAYTDGFSPLAESAQEKKNLKL